MAPIIAGLTREQLRQEVGRNTPRFYLGTTTSAPGDATSVIDTSLRGGDDVHNGKYVRFYDGTLDGETSRADDYVQSSTDITVSPAFTGNVPTAANYELWHHDFNPTDIDQFIKQAIMETYGRAYAPVEDISLHLGGGTTNTSSANSTFLRSGGDARFDVPSTIDAIRRIEYRVGVSSQELHACEAAFDESVDADFTVTADTVRKRRGNASVKFVVAGTVSDGDLVSDSITSINISDKTHVELWVTVENSVASDDLKLRLSATANGATETESLTIPAITALTDTFVRIPLANPQDDTAIISIALEYNANSGVNTIWLDDIQAIDNNSAIWGPVSLRGWRLEPGTSDLIITEEARIDIGYSLLKLIGGDSPLLLAADTDVNEIDDEFVVYRATELAYLAKSLDNPNYQVQAAQFGQRAAMRRRHLHRLPGARKVI